MLCPRSLSEEACDALNNELTLCCTDYYLQGTYLSSFNLIPRPLLSRRRPMPRVGGGGGGEVVEVSCLNKSELLPPTAKLYLLARVSLSRCPSVPASSCLSHLKAWHADPHMIRDARHRADVTGQHGLEYSTKTIGADQNHRLQLPGKPARTSPSRRLRSFLPEPTKSVSRSTTLVSAIPMRTHSLARTPRVLSPLSSVMRVPVTSSRSERASPM